MASSPWKDPRLQFTREDVDAVRDLKGVRELNEKLSNPISTKKCKKLAKMKERLRIALKRDSGQMKDVTALGDVMQARKHSDDENRKLLLQYFIRLKVILFEMDQELKKQVTKGHLGREGSAEELIQKFSEQLHDPPKKMVVTGETSSGKSTLLNIFLSEEQDDEVLPVHTLSCTATVCEMSYSEDRTATVVYRDRRENVPFEDRKQLIFQKSERDALRDRFLHDAVQLTMPAPFLKSGVTLVDTPGVGESKEMGNILKDFVRQNDVFGFIFTIDSSRAGGVLEKFKNLLRDLSTDEYLDKYKQRKFTPACCVFVANKWDVVPEEDKDATKENIEKTLTSLPFMNNFNAQKQIFYMDAEFAYNSKHGGLMTDDFEKFIDGLSGFVLEEQKRKLRQAYGWLQNFLERLLHPVRSYMRRLGQGTMVRHKNKEKGSKRLDKLQKQLDDLLKQTRKELSKKIIEICDHLLQYMKSEEAKKRVSLWKQSEVPKYESGNDWVLTEIALDEVIDERVSDVIQEWEQQNHLVSKMETELLEKFGFYFEMIELDLEALERDIRSTNQRIETIKEQTDYEEEDSGSSEAVEPPKPTTPEKKQFTVDFGKTFGNDIMRQMGVKSNMENIMESLASGPVLKILRSKDRDQTLSDVEKFMKNRLDYMSERAKKIYERMCTDDFTREVIKKQVDAVMEYLDTTDRTTSERMNLNRKLLINLAGEKRGKEQVREIYRPVENKILDLLDLVLQFGKSHVVAPDFFDEDFTKVSDNFETTSLFCSLAHGVMKAKKDYEKKSDVTLKRTRGLALTMRPSDRYFQEKNIRQFAKRGDVVKLLGTYHRVSARRSERLLVLEGNLYPARKHLLLKMEAMSSHVYQTQFNLCHQFLVQLGSAVAFLHLNKLVHIELSLDSILVRKKVDSFYVTSGTGLPLLCNLSEPTWVPISKNRDVKLAHYIHLPPEVLKERTMYTHEADIYALGIIMLELFYLNNIFEETKSTMTLGDWIDLSDQGAALKDISKKSMKKKQPGEKMSPKWKELMNNCLDKDPLIRPTAKVWQDCIIHRN